MPTPAPCRAKNPRECPHHGLVPRAEAAIANGDWQGYRTVLEDLKTAPMRAEDYKGGYSASDWLNIFRLNIKAGWQAFLVARAGTEDIENVPESYLAQFYAYGDYHALVAQLRDKINAVDIETLRDFKNKVYRVSSLRFTSVGKPKYDHGRNNLQFSGRVMTNQETRAFIVRLMPYVFACSQIERGKLTSMNLFAAREISQEVNAAEMFAVIAKFLDGPTKS